jgi:acyl carrier protein
VDKTSAKIWYFRQYLRIRSSQISYLKTQNSFANQVLKKDYLRMTKTQFYCLLDELLELDSGTIKGDELLSALPKWDSLALMGFIALIDQHFGLIIPAVRIAECKTVEDLTLLVGDRIHR